MLFILKIRQENVKKRFSKFEDDDGMERKNYILHILYCEYERMKVFVWYDLNQCVNPIISPVS